MNQQRVDPRLNPPPLFLEKKRQMRIATLPGCLEPPAVYGGSSAARAQRKLNLNI